MHVHCLSNNSVRLDTTGLSKNDQIFIHLNQKKIMKRIHFLNDVVRVQQLKFQSIQTFQFYCYLDSHKRVLNSIFGHSVYRVQGVGPRSNSDLLDVSDERESPVNSWVWNLDKKIKVWRNFFNQIPRLQNLVIILFPL